MAACWSFLAIFQPTWSTSGPSAKSSSSPRSLSTTETSSTLRSLSLSMGLSHHLSTSHRWCTVRRICFLKFRKNTMRLRTRRTQAMKSATSVVNCARVRICKLLRTKRQRWRRRCRICVSGESALAIATSDHSWMRAAKLCPGSRRSTRPPSQNLMKTKST